MIVSATTLLRHLSVSEPGAVATGSSAHLNKRNSFGGLQIDPVAIARGSDTFVTR